MCRSIDIKALSQRISLSPRSIRKLIAEGIIPALRPSGRRGGKLLFHEGDVEAALRGKTARAGDAAAAGD